MQQIYSWQQSEWQQLLSSYRQDRLPHAMLFSGAAGLGKRDFALAFSEFLLCEQAEQQACGKCRSCQLLQAETHPDLSLVTAAEKGGAIKVEQIRELVSGVSQKSHRGGYQVIIVAPADAMNISASNALLKTLEEPTGSVVLILVTAQPTKLLPTIRSRCQQLRFLPPAVDVAREWLVAHQVDQAATDRLLQLTDNAPLRALAMHGEALNQRTKFAEIFTSFLHNNSMLGDFVNEALQFEVVEALVYLQQFVSELIRTRVSQTQGSNASLLKLFGLYDYLLQLSAVVGNNLNSQLMFEDIALRLTNVS